MKQSGQLFKGSLTTIILKLLSEQEKMYGYEITRKVKELSNGEILLTEGALYPALHKLEAEELLSVTVENIGNRFRKYYSLTKKGNVEVVNKVSELKEFFMQMQTVLNLQLLSK